MARPRPLAEAAKQFGVHPATVRRWVAAGAPTVRLGRGARGHGSLVDPDQLKAWYAQRHSLNGSVAHGVTLDQLAMWCWDFLKRDCDLDMPAHCVLSLAESDAAAYLALLFRYLAIRMGRELTDEEYPAEVKQLLAIARTGAHD